MIRPFDALRTRISRRRGEAVVIDRRVLDRPPAARWPAFVALAIGTLAVSVVVLVSQQGRQVWSPVGAPEIVESVPDEVAIAIFAKRIDGGRLAIVGLARGRGQRCLEIQFSVDGEPGRSAPVLGDDCRPGEITGRGITIEDDQGVRVYGGGKLLEDVRATALGDCGSGRNLCAMAFDRHAERLELSTRKRASGESDRDDQLLAVLRTGGRATQSPEAKRPTPRDAYFGDVTAQLWAVSVEIAGKATPTPAQVIGALLTRRPAGFTVLVNDDRIGGSTRSLVSGGDGAFVED